MHDEETDKDTERRYSENEGKYVGGVELENQGVHESMRGVFRGCQLIYIYKVSCHSHARQQQTIHLYVQHGNRVTRKVTRDKGNRSSIICNVNSPRSYQQGQRNEGVSMIARDTMVRIQLLARKKKGKKK